MVVLAHFTTKKAPDECSTGAFVVLLKLLLLLVFQQIANFRKQFFFVAGFCWWLGSGRLFFLTRERIDTLDEYEDAESNNREVDNILDEIAVHDFSFADVDRQGLE